MHRTRDVLDRVLAEVVELAIDHVVAFGIHPSIGVAHSGNVSGQVTQAEHHVEFGCGLYGVYRLG